MKNQLTSFEKPKRRIYDLLYRSFSETFSIKIKNLGPEARVALKIRSNAEEIEKEFSSIKIYKSSIT